MRRLAETTLLALVALLPSPGFALEIHSVAPGIYRGSAPETAADYDCLRRHGIRTVLDLRKYNGAARATERQALSCRGIAYRHVPMGFFPRRDNSVERSLAIIANRKLQPVFMHCKLGEDRVGLVVGMYRVRYQGWSPQSAYNEMLRNGFRPWIVGLKRYFWMEGAGRSPRRLAGRRGWRRR